MVSKMIKMERFAKCPARLVASHSWKLEFVHFVEIEMSEDLMCQLNKNTIY